MEPLDVYGQEKVKELIGRSVRSGTFGNSILFEGPFGVGKERMAFWLAQLLLCDTLKACGTCTPCSKVLRLSHPDLNWMIPAPGADTAPSEGDGKSGSGRKQTEREKFLAEAMESKREEPFFIPRSSRQLGHSAESIRQLLAWCAKKPFESERKIVIIRDADMMAPGIANLFLKLLEEPPLDTILILTSAMPHRLLPTVLSRCVSYRFSAVPHSLIVSSLREYGGVDEERARLLTGLAQGSLIRALELVEEEEGVRREALRIFGIAAVGRIKECYDILIASMTGRRAGNRGESLERTLFFMILVLRDLQVLAEGESESSVVNTDLIEKMRKLGGKWKSEQIGELILVLEQIRRDIRSNINLDLILWKTLDAVRTCLHEGRPNPLSPSR